MPGLFNLLESSKDKISCIGDIKRLVKYMCWVGKRNDVDERNDFNNYTNWIDEKIPPFSEAFNNIYYEII